VRVKILRDFASWKAAGVFLKYDVTGLNILPRSRDIYTGRETNNRPNVIISFGVPSESVLMCLLRSAPCRAEVDAAAMHTY